MLYKRRFKISRQLCNNTKQKVEYLYRITHFSLQLRRVNDYDDQGNLCPDFKIRDHQGTHRVHFLVYGHFPVIIGWLLIYQFLYKYRHFSQVLEIILVTEYVVHVTRCVNKEANTIIIIFETLLLSVWKKVFH